MLSQNHCWQTSIVNELQVNFLRDFRSITDHVMLYRFTEWAYKNKKQKHTKTKLQLKSRRLALFKVVLYCMSWSGDVWTLGPCSLPDTTSIAPVPAPPLPLHTAAQSSSLTDLSLHQHLISPPTGREPEPIRQHGSISNMHTACPPKLPTVHSSRCSMAPGWEDLRTFLSFSLTRALGKST